MIISEDIINKKIFAILIFLIFIILISLNQQPVEKLNIKKKIIIAIIMQNWRFL